LPREAGDGGVKAGRKWDFEKDRIGIAIAVAVAVAVAFGRREMGCSREREFRQRAQMRPLADDMKRN
jgi:hypothetical protein